MEVKDPPELENYIMSYRTKPQVSFILWQPIFSKGVWDNEVDIVNWKLICKGVNQHDIIDILKANYDSKEKEWMKNPCFVE